MYHRESCSAVSGLDARALAVWDVARSPGCDADAGVFLPVTTVFLCVVAPPPVLARACLARPLHARGAGYVRGVASCLPARGSALGTCPGTVVSGVSGMSGELAGAGADTSWVSWKTRAGAGDYDAWASTAAPPGAGARSVQSPRLFYPPCFPSFFLAYPWHSALTSPPSSFLPLVLSPSLCTPVFFSAHARHLLGPTRARLPLPRRGAGIPQCSYSRARDIVRLRICRAGWGVREYSAV
ncbi:hypothetical protein DFH09DRAFT_1300374 [Mycena vulgaris]|nr:hypothetical protein DFH09DRAFT_1300374 [Mycena vulgaris]